MDRDSRSRRYDDGEVTRYGAGESYRPFNDRAATRRPRTSPRPRSPPPRERARSPPALDSDRYIPDRDRTPRRRSRSADRFRRDRSRDRDVDRPTGGDSWRRRERTRSPQRRPSPPASRRSPLPPPHPRRQSPPPRRFSPRRDIRDDRDRPRSPRRGYDSARSHFPSPHIRAQHQYPPYPEHTPAPPPSYPPPFEHDLHYSSPGRNASGYGVIAVARGAIRARQHPAAAGSGGSDNPNAVPIVKNRLAARDAVQNGSPGSAQFSPDKRHTRRSSELDDFHAAADAKRDALSNMPYRGRSRSPIGRERRDPRDARDRDRRSPGPRRPSPPRGVPYRRRSPSMDRRDDRFGPSSRRPSPPPPPRDPVPPSIMHSRDISRRSSPHPVPARSDERSMPHSPNPSRPLSRSSNHAPAKERSPVRAPADAPARSPPRGPAIFNRAPPTGPRDSRDTRDTRDTRDLREPRRETAPTPSRAQPAPAPAPVPAPAPAPAPPSRQDMPSPSQPPSGPRGYVPSRGSYGRGSRGGSWNSTTPGRNMPPAMGSGAAGTGSNNVPTGPRATPTSSSVPSTPVAQSKPFNPPKGPAADLSSKRSSSYAEQLLSSLPPIIPGGKVDPALVPVYTGVSSELQAHYNQLKEEEERIRQEMYVKQEKLRKSLTLWDKLERETKVLELKSTLSEQTLAKISGEGVGGAAF